MKPRERVAFSAIVDRPPLELPPGVRLVVWPIINLEEWDIERPMARQVLPAPTGVPLLPDVPNWSWHEYGMRVGVWRFLAAFDAIGARGTLSINAKVVESYPRVAGAAKERGWEFMGHSYVQGPIHKLDDQRATIHQSLDLLEKFTGRRPVGWLGPGLTETYETPELLAEAGVQYIGDWVYDDEPTEIATAKGTLVTLPYTVELNDIPMMIVQHHAAEELLRRATDQFDRLYREGAERAKILSLAIHPYITGVPHRIKYLEAFLDYAKRHTGVVFWTGEEILAWYRQARG
ncbi:MAG TPA: polysaccharide deacetylase family protein [Stellaceae bacterium]|jgi:peptidoglycan/xylan/chitin deacetylase (PgdA/CDA1 family)|nr:polysaccharide deacetylase family protein [Stellaceae bacterium]